MLEPTQQQMAVAVLGVQVADERTRGTVIERVVSALAGGFSTTRRDQWPKKAEASANRWASKLRREFLEKCLCVGPRKLQNYVVSDCGNHLQMKTSRFSTYEELRSQGMAHAESHGGARFRDAVCGGVHQL